jgi:phosphoribosylaminoimidazole-succinocarboxamide synthase
MQCIFWKFLKELQNEELHSLYSSPSTYKVKTVLLLTKESFIRPYILMSLLDATCFNFYVVPIAIHEFVQTLSKLDDPLVTEVGRQSI